MTISSGVGSASNSRNSKSRSKVSSSKLRCSQTNASGVQSLGGHPLSGSVSNATKVDIKHRFEINRKLGSGTYGKVSLAYDHKTEREVAVKLIKKSAIENKQDLIRIRREIRIMSALKHPNIIQIYEVFENRDKIILVMEYASGGELYDYVSTFGSLPEAEARRIFRQITSAVLYCHKHKVAHRDLKLENILLDGDSNAKIADFGLSNYFSDKTLLSTFCGSPLYASPEIINGTPYRGPEVDCWSLGILLYTLVYGSMPFDGRDFNRMVRQIKRGAYFEPDTPSTASMLIRNMLRVNPERRSNIDEIASHWWLNLEENMPVIQELPENQILDHTPLTERAETILVQDLADETDVFMDFGHLSASTRKKIEEFRRRRREAEDYIENSPIKPPKSRKTNENIKEKEMLTKEKSLCNDIKVEVENVVNPVDDMKEDFNEPLERLKRLENRLQHGIISRKKEAQSKKEQQIEQKTKVESDSHPFSRVSEKNPLEFPTHKANKKDERLSPEQPDDPITENSRMSGQTASVQGTSADSYRPSFVSLDSPVPPIRPERHLKIGTSLQTLRMETDILNMLMNQVLEQMESGPVSMNLIVRIKSHPLYDTRPMVKELLESIIAAQPPSVQREASKIIQQQSQELIKRQQSGSINKNSNDACSSSDKKMKDLGDSGTSRLPFSKANQRIENFHKRKTYKERPWHSVEVGFDPDEDQKEQKPGANMQSSVDMNTEVNYEVPERGAASRKLSVDKKHEVIQIIEPNKLSDTIKEEIEENGATEDDQEELDSEIDELGDEVEQVEDEDNTSYSSALSAQNTSELIDETIPPPDPQTRITQYTDNLDRCLSKRQSRGKYQHSKVEMYGRGVSMECESPTFSHRKIGGPQPTIERSPFLFDKAKKYIMTYPKHVDDSEDDIPYKTIKKMEEDRKSNWLETHDPDALGSSTENASRSQTPLNHIPSLLSRPIPSATKSEDEESFNSEEDEESEEEEDESPPPSSGFPNMVVSQGNSYILKIKDRSVFEKNLNMNSVSKPQSQSNDNAPNSTLCDLNISNQNPRAGMTESFPKSSLSITPTINDYKRTNTQTYRDKENQRDQSNIGTNHLADHAYGRYTTQTSDKFSSDSSNRTNAGNDNLYYRSDERRKSKSLHDLSPDRQELKIQGISQKSSTTNDRYNPTITSDRYNYEAPSLQSWAHEPKRFYVYQTRAEREAERNTAANNLHASSTYRPTGWSLHTSVGGDRQGSSYTPGYFRSKFDDNFTYRKAINDTDPPNVGNDVANSSTYQSSYTPNEHNTGFASRFRPVSRKIASTLTEPDKRDYGRSQSVDRKIYNPEENDYQGNMRNRLMTPEVNSNRNDYSYVNYHDTSSARFSIPREPDTNRIPSRGILKNRQSVDSELKTNRLAVSDAKYHTEMKPILDNNRVPGMKNVFDRLKRHLSVEKSLSPVNKSPFHTKTSRISPIRNTIANGEKDTNDAPVYINDAGHATLTNKGGGKSHGEENQKSKKKLFSSLGRRRTTEMRLGPDGKIITSGYEDDYKRPASPIDRIKSLFRKSKERIVPNVSSDTASPSVDYSHYNKPHLINGSNRYGVSDRTYGVHPIGNISGLSTKESTYVPQYRKYTGANAGTSVFNRYSYTPGALGSERLNRHWN